jgi:hypothetical protein
LLLQQHYKFIALLLFSSERNLANEPISLKHRCGGKAGKTIRMDEVDIAASLMSMVVKSRTLMT